MHAGDRGWGTTWERRACGETRAWEGDAGRRRGRGQTLGGEGGGVAQVALTTDVVHLAHFLPSELSTPSGAQRGFLFCIYAQTCERTRGSCHSLVLRLRAVPSGGRVQQIGSLHHRPPRLAVLFSPSSSSPQLSSFRCSLSLDLLFVHARLGRFRISHPTSSQSLPIYLYLSAWPPSTSR